MDWRPNLEAIQWWLQNVYPLCKKEMPQIELHLAGKHMPKDIFDMADNRTLFAYNKIVTVKEFMADKQIMIVPLLSGGGMRVKIIEGLAAGRVVISTSIGAEGIAAIAEKEILIANTPQEFIAQLKSIIDDKLRMQNISKAAKEKAHKLYDVNVCGAQVKLFLKKIIGHTMS
jgi:glycosyltransferase involved in cell wall biosynthesis